MKAYQIRSIGENRGRPRVWIEGTQPARAGFEPGAKYRIFVDREAKTIRLTTEEDGDRVVSKKTRGEREIPVIDLNSAELLSIFDGQSSVRVIFNDGQIHLMPLASEMRRVERLARLEAKVELGHPLSIGSVSHGGGVLSHALHAGLADAGVKCELAFANDIREDLLEQAATANDAWSEATQYLAAPIQEAIQDRYVVAKLPPVEILEGGIPCSGASVAGRAKRGLSMPEEHPEVGHLVYGFLRVIEITNPAVVVLENVPQWASSASAAILRNQLRDMAYEVHEAVLDSREWSAYEDRKRLCLIAVTRGLNFSMDEIERPPARETRLAEILEPLAEDDPRWSRMEGLKAKQERDRAAGKGFMMQVFGPEDRAFKTLTKSITKNRSTDPKVRHPSDPDLLRNPTPVEHARAKGAPERLIDGLSATIAHELLGQSVVYAPFRSVGRAVGKTIAARCIEVFQEAA